MQYVGQRAKSRPRRDLNGDDLVMPKTLKIIEKRLLINDQMLSILFIVNPPKAIYNKLIKTDPCQLHLYFHILF